MANCISAVLLMTFCVGVFCKECINGPSYRYSGTRSTTKSGLTCQRWDATEPHQVKYTPEDGGNHNYCRNPEKDSRGTWCYTTDASQRWEYCGLPKCDNPALAVWTGYDESKDTAFFEFAKADPEHALQNGIGSFSHRKVFENAQFRGLDVSEDGEEIYFTDVKNNYFGVFNTETFKVERYLQGEAVDIHAIVQDRSTEGFYWTDIKTKNVMYADRRFKSQATIYNAAPSQPQAIAILPDKKGIVFSTQIQLSTKIQGAEIITADMDGMNSAVLIKSPEVINVTGLAVDGERIYWTDNLGYASRVVSCRFDGSDKVEHYSKKYSLFQDLAVYSDYIYITDARTKYNYFDEIRYHIEVIGKDTETRQEFIYTKPSLPHGIAILSELKEKTMPAKFGEEKIPKKKSG